MPKDKTVEPDTTWVPVSPGSKFDIMRIKGEKEHKVVEPSKKGPKKKVKGSMLY